MANQEEMYNVFGLNESDLKAIESPNKESIELQLKIFKENYLRKLVISNG